VILTRLAMVVRGESEGAGESAPTAIIVAPDLPKLFPKPRTMTGTEERERVQYKSESASFQAEYTGSTIFIRASWARDLGPMLDLLGDKASAVGNQYVYEYTFENIEAFAPVRERVVKLFKRITRS